MEKIEFEKRILKFERKLKKDETYRINRGTNFFTISVFKKPVKIIGFSNVCEDLKYIPVWDYDNVYLKIVEEDFAILQKRYGLTAGYIFSTKEEEDEFGIKGNFHVVCLKKFSYKEVSEVIGESRCDPNYKSMNTRTSYRSWILRISPKANRARPKFYKMVGSEDYYSSGDRISEAHLKLLEKIYLEIPKIPYQGLLDGLKQVNIQEYESLNF